MFQNAYEGVKKIHKAQILALIATILILAGGILALTGMKAADGSDTQTGLAIGAGLFVIAAAILMIISAIMSILGVSRASKDENAFKNALIALGLDIAANILVSAFSNNATVTSIGKAVVNVTEILASYYICTGVINLSDRLGNSEVSARGKKIRSLIMGIYVAAAVLNLVAMLTGASETMQMIIGICGIIAGIISIVALFLYIGLLGKARDMLEK